MMHSDNNTFTGKVIKAAAEEVTLPNGLTVVYDIVRHPGGAAVVAMNAANQVCLLRHFRHIANDWLWELPAGKLEQGEAPVKTGQRELMEETGIRAEKWCELGTIWSSPGVFDEKIFLYLATGVTQGQQQKDVDELIEVEWVDFTQALEWVKNGQILDAKTIAGLVRAENHLI